MRTLLSIHQEFWNLPLLHLLQTLKTSLDGLNHKEVLKRLKKFGPNEISLGKETVVFYQLLRRFKNPLVILLLVTCFGALILKQRSDFFIIVIMVFMSIAVGFFQEYSANQAAKKLRELIVLKAKVLRDGCVKVLPVKDLVPGDIVYLKAGDLVPADGRLLWENHLFVNQAILTGESFPVEKNTDEQIVSQKSKSSLEGVTNSVFMGTSVISGEARMLVCSTGNRTYLGSIAENLKEEPLSSQFELETRRFGFFLMKTTIFLVLFVLMVNVFIHRSWLETFLFALALAIGMSPEFLPMVMSVTLSRGAKNMAKKKVIVKRLSAIHDLGSMNILCTDKTGTLTRAKVQLTKHMDGNGKENERVLYLAYLNSYFETGLKNPMDEAILNHKKINVDEWKKIDEIPFDFERRRVSVLLDNKQERMIIVKGAPEDIISICTHYENKERQTALTFAIKKKLLHLYHQESKKGFRILAVAWQSCSKSHGKALIDDEINLTFSGFALFYDPPKSEATKTLENLKAEKVEVYILTGDSEDVTMHLCQELNIPIKGVLTGKELSSLDNDALTAHLRNTNLYCRITPSQKRRIILELKSLGYVVGFLGDGINDAPALSSANVGISVDTGADVSKEAADLILLQDNLEVVHAAVIEGRKIYSNIIKYVMMVTSADFGNMCSMAGAFLFLPFLPMLPTQILLNDLLYDISQTAIPFDNVDAESVLSPKQLDLKLILKFMLIMGPLSSIFDFLIFFIMLKILKTPPALFQTGWFMESLATQILIIFVIRTCKPVFQSKPHIFLIILAVLLVSIAMMIPYTCVGSYFGFVPPPFYFFMVFIGIIVVYLALVEKIKLLFYRKIA